MRWGRALGWAAVAVALAVHLIALVGVAWPRAAESKRGRDYASYHYAAQVAWEGGDPYDKGALAAAARADGTRDTVNPFFYPPPFLLFTAWTVPLDLVTAYRAWFWLDELLVLAAALALWRWWRPLGPAVGPALAVAVAAWTSIPNTHVMGQANGLVLALALVGLWQADRGRPWLGGAAVGAACVVKMSPALFVAWWLLRRRWRPVLAAVVAGAVLEVAALAVASPEAHLVFWTEVLPGFTSGAYNGLTVPIGLFGNHSIPDLLHQAFPGTPHALSPLARALAAVAAAALLGGAAWLFRREPPDLLARSAQVCAVAVIMLLIPVYTYEHHLVWALPGAALTATAVLTGRMHWRWLLALLPAWTALGWELAELKRTSLSLRLDAPLVAWMLQEAKFVALLVLLAALLALGRRRPL